MRLRVGEISYLDCKMKASKNTYRAATDERTGEVREMRVRNVPENARSCQRVPNSGRPTHWHLPTLKSVASKQPDRVEFQTSRFQCNAKLLKGSRAQVV